MDIREIKARVAEECGAILEETRKHGLRHGRVSFDTAALGNSVQALAWFDVLHDAGCTIVAVNEYFVAPRLKVPGAEPMLRYAVLFRLPLEVVQ